MAKVRNICITLNNPTDEEYLKLQERDCGYCILGREVGEGGTPHIQGYYEFKNPVSFNGLKKDFPRMHIERRIGTSKQAADYCKKEGNFWEKGVLSVQGKRNDIAVVKELLEDGAGMRDVVTHVNSYQAMRCGELILKYKERTRDWKPTVYWFWGPTGTGKTRTAFELCGENEPWVSGKDLQWWDGYDAHENVIIDEFRGDFCKFHELLKILDRYPYRVMNKGGSRQLLATTIYITSCFPPDKVYESREDIGQLLRRVDHIVFTGTEVPEHKSGVILETPPVLEVDNIVFTDEDLEFLQSL